MAFKITKEGVFDSLKNSGKYIGSLALEIYVNSLNQEGERAFFEAIEIGIENTIASLYDASVHDDEIIRVVSEHWGLQKPEVEQRLLYEKSKAPVRALEHYLKMQGFSKGDIEKFMKQNKVHIKIKHNKDLWKLKSQPKKLIDAIKETEED